MARRLEGAKRRTVAAVGLSAAVILAVSVAAPIFGWTSLYAALGTACHQDVSRCLSIGDMPMALCARCAAIFAGLLVGSGLVLRLAPYRYLALRLFLAAVLLTVFDVMAETAGLYSNLIGLRMATGWGLGLCVVLTIGCRERSEFRSNPTLIQP